MKVDVFLKAAGEALNLDRPLRLDETPESTPEWDSIGHLSILAMIDGEFGIEASDDALTRPKSVADLVNYLKGRNLLED